MSSSSNNAPLFIKLDEREDRVAKQNHQLDRIIEDVVNLTATMSIQPTNHVVRVRRRYIERKREKGQENLFEQYFSEDSIYPLEVFRRRFRMQKLLFERIINKVVATDEFFEQRCDVAGRLGMSSIQKCTTAMRVLAYGTSAQLHDDYLRMSAQTIRKSVVKFVQGVIFNFGVEYLRKPNEQDMSYILQIGEQCGFPSMMGSIDCMHWEWQNCPSGWARQYAGRSGKPTIVLEAVASQDLWIWHAFFETPGSRNDNNVLY